MCVLSKKEMCGYLFTCPKCGGHVANKIVFPYGERNFYSGYWMCNSCGTSLCDGEIITYYSSCFHFIGEPVQLSLF